MTTLNQTEKDFYISKGTGNSPIAQQRKEYRNGGIYPVGAEKKWLREQITMASTTPSGNYISGLWVQLLSALNLPVSASLTQNRKTYFATQ